MLAVERTVSIALCSWLLPSCGCRAPERIVLCQPQTTGPEREVHLDATRGYFTFERDRPTGRLLFAWALPGSRDGPTWYSLYLRIPRDNGTYKVGKTVDEDSAVAGFLIQHRGRRAGITAVESGYLTLGGAGADPGRRIVGAVALTFSDKTNISGRFVAERRRLPILLFEREHDADVAVLWKHPGDKGQPRPKTGKTLPESEPRPASEPRP